MLTVTSIEDAVDFYSTMLGFQVASSAEGWACVRLDGVEVMFALPNAHIPFTRPKMTGSLIFKVDDASSF